MRSRETFGFIRLPLRLSPFRASRPDTFPGRLVLYVRALCIRFAMPKSEQMEGQMTIDECIEVARTGSDGKPPVVVPQQPERRTNVEQSPSGGRKAA